MYNSSSIIILIKSNKTEKINIDIPVDTSFITIVISRLIVASMLGYIKLVICTFLT